MEKLLLEILNELKAQNTAQAELWNAEDIARYMRLFLKTKGVARLCSPVS